jgi:hypothetical protein
VLTGLRRAWQGSLIMNPLLPMGPKHTGRDEADHWLDLGAELISFGRAFTRAGQSQGSRSGRSVSRRQRPHGPLRMRVDHAAVEPARQRSLFLAVWHSRPEPGQDRDTAVDRWTLNRLSETANSVKTARPSPGSWAWPADEVSGHRFSWCRSAHR